MSEAVVVNAFLVVRVFLVGAILQVLPRISRKGLVFGVYVGEAMADEEVARRILSSWQRACVLLMVLSLVVGLGISQSGWPVAGNLTGTVVLLLGAGVIYLRMHIRARALAAPAAERQAAMATATLQVSAPPNARLAKVSLGVCLVVSVTVFAYALSSYRAMTDTSLTTILLYPGLNLMLSPYLALVAVLTATAKRSVRGGTGGNSTDAQNAFRTTMTGVHAWTALLYCAFMAVMSVQIVRFELSESKSIGYEVLWLAGIVIVFMLANLVRIMWRFGQGGARLESGTVDAPLTDGLADNDRWFFGMIYFDHEDPSILVESRFGIGYTLNYGNRVAVLVMISFVLLSLGLIALALFGAATG